MSLPCPSLGFGDDRRSTSRSRDASLTIFITSMSGGKSLGSFTNVVVFFLITFSTLTEHQALGCRLTRSKEMKYLAAFSVREVKRAAAEERKEYSCAEGQ